MHQPKFDRLLEESATVHGHLCPGQVLGVRMALYGLDLIGIQDPKGRDRKRIYLFVEIDRCATDALQSVTGCSLGRRTMRFLDYGKMAATFVNLETGRAVRVVAREESKMLAKRYFPQIDDKHRCQLEAYRVMSEADLFVAEEVIVSIPPQDRPGRPTLRVRCEACGEFVQDGREAQRERRVLCRPCASGAYYSPARSAVAIMQL
jgi:formylmethanofuran dehydrogenase subunit E